MTLQELASRTRIGVCLGGHFKVTIEYRGKTYSCISTNTMAYDDRHDCWKDREYTVKQAYQALYNECKRKNNLR